MAGRNRGRTEACGRAERGEAGEGSVGEARGGAAEVLEGAAVQIGYLALQLLHLRLVLRGCSGGRSLALALVGRGSASEPPAMVWIWERSAARRGWQVANSPGPTRQGAERIQFGGGAQGATVRAEQIGPAPFKIRGFSDMGSAWVRSAQIRTGKLGHI